MNTNLYIWQKEDWPHFTWKQEELLPLLYETSSEKSYFLGRLSMLGLPEKEASFLNALEEEVLGSNSIEDINLKRDSVRSSILSRLGYANEGIQDSDRYTDGAVNIVIDAVANRNMPLTKERLFGWHTELFPEGISDGRRILTGRWRQGEMYVVSGRVGKEIIHYEAPPASVIDKGMDEFLKFVNEENNINPLIKAAVAHFWFVTIHPFSDGNGRIGRTISEMLLARSDNTDHRYYSLSSAIMNSRQEYYDTLEYCQKSTLDITRFIVFFLETLRDAVRNAENATREAIAKTRFWDAIRPIPLNERQIKLINKLYDGFEGKLTTEKWAKIAKCSHSTALRDINELIDKGILIAEGTKSKNIGYKLNIE